jgi:hypothetical protein
MCAYKVVRAHFNVFPMQSTVERIILDSQRGLFGRTLAAAFATIDKWIGLVRTPQTCAHHGL